MPCFERRAVPALGQLIAFSRRCCLYTFLLGLSIQPVLGLPIELALVNIQPINVESIEDQVYDPTVDLVGTSVLLEPIQLTSLTIPSFRTNLDFEVVNNETGWLRLDALEVEHVGGGLPPLILTGDELFGYDSSLYTVPPSNPEKKRPAILNGGFGASGMLIQRRLHKEHMLDFGAFEDVVAYTPPGAKSASYAMTGNLVYYIGDPPEQVGDPFDIRKQAVLARFDSNARLVSYRTFSGDSLVQITEIGDGQFLVLGEDFDEDPDGTIDKSIRVGRVVLYQLDDEGGGRLINNIGVDQNFGIEGFVPVTFEQDGSECNIIDTIGLTPIASDSGIRTLVGTVLVCNGQSRIGVAMLDEEGDLVSSFGDEGTLILAGPGDTNVRGVGLEASGRRQSSHVAWVAARTGENCDFNFEDCRFGLTRLTLTGHDSSFDWVEVDVPDVDWCSPSLLVVDSAGLPIIGGKASLAGESYIALARFKPSGNLDASFGGSAGAGFIVTQVGGKQARLRDLVESSNGTFWAALSFVHDELPGGGGDAFGIARLDDSGATEFYHDTLDSATPWQHRIPGENFNYGSYLEPGIQGFAEALAEDDQGRVVVVGKVGSQILPDSWWGGPYSMAVARYLPSGEPHSRRWVEPGATIGVRVPEDRTFGTSPTQVSIRIDVMDGTTVDFQLDRDTQPLTGNAVDSNEAPGGYQFPIQASELAFDEAVTISGHTLTHHHRHSSSSRFAYDLGVGRWNGVTWVGLKSGTDGSVNQDFLPWNRKVRATAAGRVVACRRSAPDNDPGIIAGTPANFVKIQHAFDPIDKSRREYVDYLHLKQDSIPMSVCPLICPEEDPECDPSLDGVDPDGRELPVPVAVAAKATIGRIGNSGNTTGPHLHIQLTTGAGGKSKDPVAGGIPMLFQNVFLGDRYDPYPSQIEPLEWFPIHNLALPHGYLAIPGN